MAASFTSCLQTEEVDLVVHNAIIYTVDNLFSTTEAMAIRNDTIVAIGAEREILNKYSAKEKVDAKKRPVFPGFIDAHCHFLGYGLSLQQVDLVGTKSFDEVIERVVEFSKNSKAKWITGRGWDQNDWEVKEFPNKEILDSLFPETPVLIRRIDGHAALANQKALNKANVTIESKINGGIIEMKDDKLTGILIDNAIGLVGKAVPRTNKEQKIKALLDAQQNCFAVGLTTVDDAGMSKSEIELIDQLQKEGKLKMKIYAMLSDTKENFDHYLITGPYKTERLNVRSFKFYADGALGSRGACLLEPYSDIIESEHYGLILNEENHFKNYAQKLLEMGFQMNTHCIGDSANRLILDIYAEVLQGTNDKRWRIEHAQVVHSDDFQKFGKCNIIPSVQPTHATSDMYWAKDRLGPKRVKGAYAFKDLLQQNGILALGTDFPVEGISPFKTFYAAVARMDSNGFPKNGYQMENALSREETLRGMTIGAAITNFEENEKGSLEVGKKADFVILDRDIMKVSIEELLNTKVIATFVNGEKVYGN
ncbi:MAG: amidohydrolase [Flavobacteriales bacterium]|nr:MAG: amidohydrolase [Flavobacteriales bacterium]